MPNTLVRIYDNFSSAQHARDQLLASGFSPDCVHLDSLQDEAGPVEGNGVLDTKDVGKRPRSSTTPFRTKERPGDYSNTPPVWRSNYQLTVDAQSDEQRARARDIMERSGARDVDDFASWRRHES